MPNKNDHPQLSKNHQSNTRYSNWLNWEVCSSLKMLKSSIIAIAIAIAMQPVQSSNVVFYGIQYFFPTAIAIQAIITRNAVTMKPNHAVPTESNEQCAPIIPSFGIHPSIHSIILFYLVPVLRMHGRVFQRIKCHCVHCKQHHPGSSSLLFVPILCCKPKSESSCRIRSRFSFRNLPIDGHNAFTIGSIDYHLPLTPACPTIGFHPYTYSPEEDPLHPSELENQKFPGPGPDTGDSTTIPIRWESSPKDRCYWLLKDTSTTSTIQFHLEQALSMCCLLAKNVLRLSSSQIRLEWHQSDRCYRNQSSPIS
mmetsp:Transcript_571/g.1172  ORF Transcript_571/g.1172 Transcript_571/m.1172 type:complete len:309 (-) Transcript_571:672-1598(-)